MNTGAGLNHGGAEGSAAHRTTTFFIYIAEDRFWIKEESGSERKLERGQRDF
jgi:hypothetical protein